MQKEPRSHHHLPQFYMAQWADKAGKVRVLRRCNDGSAKEYFTGTRAIGFQNVLWSLLAPLDGRSGAIETDFLSPLDGDASQILPRLLSKNCQLTIKERERWATFLISLHIRVPERIQRVQQDTPELLRTLSATDNISSEDAPGMLPIEELTGRVCAAESVDAGTYLIPGIISEADNVRALLGMRWEVLDLSCATNQIVTTDWPVMNMCPPQEPEALVMLPLSPTHLFIAGRNIKTVEQILRRSANSLVRVTNEALVDHAPSFVIGSCRKTFVERIWQRKKSHPQACQECGI